MVEWIIFAYVVGVLITAIAISVYADRNNLLLDNCIPSMLWPVLIVCLIIGLIVVHVEEGKHHG